MQVQLICRSDKDSDVANALEKPFDFFSHELHLSQVILVPTLEHYHEVQGQLLINGVTAKVVCILPPSQYQPPVGSVPYALVTDDYIAKCDPLPNVGKYTDTLNLTYYFEKKDAATTNEVHE